MAWRCGAVRYRAVRCGAVRRGVVRGTLAISSASCSRSWEVDGRRFAAVAPAEDAADAADSRESHLGTEAVLPPLPSVQMPTPPSARPAWG